MKNGQRKESVSGKGLHHGRNRPALAGQAISMRNTAHERSQGLKWVQSALNKATQGAVRALTQGY